MYLRRRFYKAFQRLYLKIDRTRNITCNAYQAVQLMEDFDGTHVASAVAFHELHVGFASRFTNFLQGHIRHFHWPYCVINGFSINKTNNKEHVHLQVLLVLILSHAASNSGRGFPLYGEGKSKDALNRTIEYSTASCAGAVHRISHNNLRLYSFGMGKPHNRAKFVGDIVYPVCETATR